MGDNVVYLKKLILTGLKAFIFYYQGVQINLLVRVEI